MPETAPCPPSSSRSSSCSPRPPSRTLSGWTSLIFATRWRNLAQAVGDIDQADDIVLLGHQPDDDLGADVDAGHARQVVDQQRDIDGIGDAGVVADELLFFQVPGGRRQDRDRCGAGASGVLGQLNRLKRAGGAGADDHRHAAGDVADHVGGDGLALARLEVEELADAAEQKEAMHVVGDHAVDMPAHGRRVVGVVGLEEGRQRRHHPAQHGRLLEVGLGARGWGWAGNEAAVGRRRRLGGARHDTAHQFTAQPVPSYLSPRHPHLPPHCSPTTLAPSPYRSASGTRIRAQL